MLFLDCLSKSRARRRAQSPPTAVRRIALEPLEPRLALATLGLGIRVFDDNNGVPGVEHTASLQVGTSYWLEVIAEDQRTAQQGNPQGVVSLPVNLSWDSDNLELLNPPTSFSPNPLDPAAPQPPSTLVTDDFPLGRFVDAFAPAAGHTGFVEPPAAPVPPPAAASASLQSLRGAALPIAGNGQEIGVARGNPADPREVGFFSLLHVRAKAAANDTPFSIQVAGSMAFADAAALDGARVLSPAVIQLRDQTRPPDPFALAVTEYIEIVERVVDTSSSLSGFVYADTNLNGVLDKAADGTLLEIGLPNVTVSLFQGQDAAPTQMTTTGPDGFYHFENLAPGTYRIVETQPARYVNSLNSLGTLLAAPAGGGNNPPDLAARRGVVGPGENQFTAIVVRAGEQGIDYNFGENLIPTKNEFRARTIPRVALNQQLGVKTAFVPATAAADQIDVQVTTTDIVVTVNNAAPQVFDRSTVAIVVVDAQAGNDSVTVTGTDEAEVAHFLPSAASLRVGNDFVGANYAVLAVATEQATITAGTGGADLAIVRDTEQTSDALDASGSILLLTAGAGRIARAAKFGQARAITTAPAGSDTLALQAIDYALTLAGNWA